jgi:trigger factor
MDFAVDPLGPCRKRVKVTVPPDRVLEEYDRQYDEINDNVALPGFRKGRAPRKILEKRFGTTLGREVKEKLVQTALEKLVEDKQIEPLRPPEIDFEKLDVVPEQTFEFEFEVITKPEFETPAYKELEVEVPGVAVSAEQIDDAIDRLRRSEAVLQTVANAQVADQDVLVVDWQALDGDSVEAHDDNAYYLYGRGVLAGFVAKGLDEALQGAKPGAKASVQVQVGPDDPREELRGRKLDLNVELKEVKRYLLPEIDDAFLGRHDYDDADEMRTDIEKQLGRAAGRERDRLAEDMLVDRLLAGIEMSLPEEFVEKELEQWARRKRTGLEMDEVQAEEIEKRIDEERDDAKTTVENDMRRFFLLDRIADAEDVKVSEADLLQAIQSIAHAYGRPEEEVLASFRDGDRLQELAAQIRHRKTREVIRRQAKLVETEAPAEGKPQAKKKAAKKKAAKKKKKAQDD